MLLVKYTMYECTGVIYSSKMYYSYSVYRYTGMNYDIGIYHTW